MPLLEVRRLGLVPYAEALTLQQRLVEERRARQIPDTLLLLEHPDLHRPLEDVVEVAQVARHHAGHHPLDLGAVEVADEAVHLLVDDRKHLVRGRARVPHEHLQRGRVTHLVGVAERPDGSADAVLAGAAEMAAPVALLARRYPQYRAAPPGGPVIRVQVERWSGWAASAG